MRRYPSSFSRTIKPHLRGFNNPAKKTLDFVQQPVLVCLLTALASTAILSTKEDDLTMTPTKNEAFVSVPISSSIYNELVIRKGTPDADVADWIENVVQDYLDRTEDEGYWSEAYYEWRAENKDLEAFAEQYGDPAKGYHWAPVFLPNGTKLAMNYKGRQYSAESR